MLVSATINRMIAKKKSEKSMSDQYNEIMDQIVNRSYDIYRELVLAMNISMITSSNPVRLRPFLVLILVLVQQPVRPSKKSVVCVPFLGSSHGHRSRVMFPGWYGVGSSLKNLLMQIQKTLKPCVICTKMAILQVPSFKRRHGALKSQYEHCI